MQIYIVKLSQNIISNNTRLAVIILLENVRKCKLHHYFNEPQTKTTLQD